jgi:hypothetical protein
MNAKVKTPLVIVGQIGRYKFKAEVHPRARLIICSSERFGGFLPNSDAEARARIIARRLFMSRAPLAAFFRFWRFVEVQTCFGDVRLTRVSGLKGNSGGFTAEYHDLTPREAKKVEPFFQSLRDEAKSRPQFVETLPPSATR